MPGYSDLVSQDTVTTLVVMVEGRCTVTAIRTINTTAADAYLQIFDSATTGGITLGTTIPDWVVQADADDPSVGDGLPNGGIIFEDGVTVASTTAVDNDTTAAQHVRLAVQ